MHQWLTPPLKPWMVTAILVLMVLPLWLVLPTFNHHWFFNQWVDKGSPPHISRWKLTTAASGREQLLGGQASLVNKNYDHPWSPTARCSKWRGFIWHGFSQEQQIKSHNIQTNNKFKQRQTIHLYSIWINWLIYIDFHNWICSGSHTKMIFEQLMTIVILGWHVSCLARLAACLAAGLAARSAGDKMLGLRQLVSQSKRQRAGFENQTTEMVRCGMFFCVSLHVLRTSEILKYLWNNLSKNDAILSFFDLEFGWFNCF